MSEKKGLFGGLFRGKKSGCCCDMEIEEIKEDEPGCCCGPSSATEEKNENNDGKLNIKNVK